VNTAKTVIGAALIVFIVVIFYKLLVLSLIVVLLTVGLVILLDGIGYFSSAEATSNPPKARALTALDITILGMIAQNKNQDEIAKSTGVSPGTVAEKTATLSAGGYLAGNFLTEKGFEAVKKG